MKYTPTGAVNDPALVGELLQISRAIAYLSERILPTLYAAPEKPQEGMLVKADGTTWNPGSGAGIYAYVGGAWTALGGGSGATQLNELTDVNTSTATNRNVLVADGVDWESRALVEADISDLQTYLTALNDDTAPTLGGDLDPNSNNIAGVGTIDMVPNARSISASTNTAATDYSKIIRLIGGTGQTFTLDGDPPTNACILIDNSAGASWTIAASTSLIWAKDATTGNRNLADDGLAIALHRGSGTWIINGSDLLT